MKLFWLEKSAENIFCVKLLFVKESGLVSSVYLGLVWDSLHAAHYFIMLCNAVQSTPSNSFLMPKSPQISLIYLVVSQAGLFWIGVSMAVWNYLEVHSAYILWHANKEGFLLICRPCSPWYRRKNNIRLVFHSLGKPLSALIEFNKIFVWRYVPLFPLDV